MMRTIAIASAAALVLTSASVFAEGGSQGNMGQQKTGAQKSNARPAPEQAPTAPSIDQQRGASSRAVDDMGGTGNEAMKYTDLDPEQAKTLQQKLHASGHYQGEIDGIIGPMTIAAIRSFQNQNDLAGNGMLTLETTRALGIAVDPIEPVSGRDPMQDERQPTAGSDRFMENTDPSQQAGMAGASGEAAETMNLSEIGEDQVMELQRKLQELGHYQGVVDGKAGPLTRGALRAFYNEQARLAAQGQLTESGASFLGLDLAAGTQPPSRMDDQLEGGSMQQRPSPPSPPSSPMTGEQF